MKLIFKSLLAGLLLALFVSCGSNATQVNLKIVPNPCSVEMGGRGAKVTAQVQTSVDPNLAPAWQDRHHGRL